MNNAQRNLATCISFAMPHHTFTRSLFISLSPCNTGNKAANTGENERRTIAKIIEKKRMKICTIQHIYTMQISTITYICCCLYSLWLRLCTHRKSKSDSVSFFLSFFSLEYFHKHFCGIFTITNTSRQKRNGAECFGLLFVVPPSQFFLFFFLALYLHIASMCCALYAML